METARIPVATPRRTLVAYQAQDGNGESRIPEVRREDVGGEMLKTLKDLNTSVQALSARMNTVPAPAAQPPPVTASESDPRRERMRRFAD